MKDKMKNADKIEIISCAIHEACVHLVCAKHALDKPACDEPQVVREFIYGDGTFKEEFDAAVAALLSGIKKLGSNEPKHCQDCAMFYGNGYCHKDPDCPVMMRTGGAVCNSFVDDTDKTIRTER